jgi:hypothetical protein
VGGDGLYDVTYSNVFRAGGGGFWGAVGNGLGDASAELALLAWNPRWTADGVSESATAKRCQSAIIAHKQIPPRYKRIIFSASLATIIRTGIII